MTRFEAFADRAAARILGRHLVAMALGRSTQLVDVVLQYGDERAIAKIVSPENR